MTTTYQIKDDNDIRQYFTMIPNIVDSMGLSVFAFRLYFHIRKVAGENGVCYKGVRAMAQVCNMSIGSVTNAKKELVDRGLIKIEETVSSNDNIIHLITIVNIWNINKPQSPNSNIELENAPHEQGGCSPHEHPCSPGELINNPFNNNISTIANAIVDPAPQEPTPPAPDPIPEKPKKPERTPLEQEIMTRYSRKRPLNDDQRAIVVEIENQYPWEMVISWLRWAVVKELPLGTALNGAKKALSSWDKPKTNGNGNGKQPAAKNKGGFILDPGDYQVVYPEENLAKDKVYQQLFGGAQ